MRISPLLITAITALAAAGAAGLLVNILERKQEARHRFYRVVELTEDTEDPEIWGKNFPLHYDGYRRTVDQIRTRFGGSEAVSRNAERRRSALGRRPIASRGGPRLKAMWAGYAFARDFREDRGHAFMLEDQTFTERQLAASSWACLHCHASMVVPYRKLGGGDLSAGFDAVNALPYVEARKQVAHPIACIGVTTRRRWPCG